MIELETSFQGYRIEQLLGRGGMGEVYEAIQVSLDRRVALKVLRPELAHDPDFMQRFRREGRLQASIEHPHVLDVYEVGESSPDQLFLAMRLVEGPTLADLIASGALDADRALRLLAQVGSALDAAHSVGLLHRDVKPQNVLVGEGDHAFLADFGLSRTGADTATASRRTVGTVAYVAPEVIHGEAPGPASDRYAFAATVFHCLTGSVVFPRGSDVAVLYAHATEPPPRISERRPELPPALDGLFEVALAKDPVLRPESAGELVAKVREVLGTQALAELGPPDPIVGGEAAHATVDSPIRRSPVEVATRRRRSSAALIAIGLAAAALGAAAVALLDGGDGATVAELPTPPISKGAVALGSALGTPDATLDCRAKAPTPTSPTCAVAQNELPGAQLLVPADGVISGWTVQGASGEMALDVIRPRGNDTTRTARSQWEYVGNGAPTRFSADLPVERGDLVGLELGPGASIGVAETGGATTQRWLDPGGGAFGSPDRDGGTGFDDYQLLLRTDFVAGGEARMPRELSGAAAARAPDGGVRKRVNVEFTQPSSTVTAELVEVDGGVALDLFKGDRRLKRVFVPGLLPGGAPIDLTAYAAKGAEFGEVDVSWVNPESGRLIFHFFTVSNRQLDYVG